LAEGDVSELFSRFHHQWLKWIFEDGTDKEFRNVVSQHKPHTGGKTQKPRNIRITVKA
jgi:hypothetical protein